LPVALIPQPDGTRWTAATRRAPQAQKAADFIISTKFDGAPASELAAGAA